MKVDSSSAQNQMVDAESLKVFNGRIVVVHIIYKLDIGGMENGLVNLINHMPSERFQHVIVCLHGYTDFSDRLKVKGTLLVDMQKRRGKDLSIHIKLWRLLRKIKPQIVHTRNIATIEFQLTALMAGIGCRIHGEHGWGVGDAGTVNRKARLIRRVFKFAINNYICVSKHIEAYLREEIGVSVSRISQVYNGVDATKFIPSDDKSEVEQSDPFIIGTVGRLDPVKDHETLLKAVSKIINMSTGNGVHARLVIVGDGPMRQHLQHVSDSLGLQGIVEFTGARSDIAEVLNKFDVFVLPSKAEGISNTILEAMACGLPVIATRVGGNPELVIEGVNGDLVAATSPDELANAILEYINDPSLVRVHGINSRKRIEDLFSMDSMVNGYMDVYHSCLN